MVKANQARSAGAGARALYLGHRDKKRVSCTDEALVVHNDRAQTLRYPLACVARVVSSTVVDWTGDALAQCMRRGRRGQEGYVPNSPAPCRSSLARK